MLIVDARGRRTLLDRMSEDRPRASDRRSSLKSRRVAADPEGMQQQRRERIELETARYRMVGYVTLAQNGFRSRVSDLLNATEREFLSLTEVTITPLDGGETTVREFVAVSRQQIVFVAPVEADARVAA
jgi:hypothetical protein